MHAEVLAWVEHCLAFNGQPLSVVEIGGRDINGSVRPLFQTHDYATVDLIAGPGVHFVGDVIDLVADGTLPTEAWACVVSTEALEHHPRPGEVLAAAHALLRPGGLLIATMAGPGRHPHSGVVEGPVQAGEHYRNIEPAELAGWLAGWFHVEIDQDGLDLRCWAVK